MSDKCETCGKATNYNGWRNYETWHTALWLGNDKKSDTAIRTLVKARGVAQAAETLKERYGALAETMSLISKGGTPFGMEILSGLLSAALSDVEWYDVARHFKPEEWGDHDGRPVTWRDLDRMVGDDLSTDGYSTMDYRQLARDMGCELIEE